MKTIQIHNIVGKIQEKYPEEWKSYTQELVSHNCFLLDDSFLYSSKWIINDDCTKLGLILKSEENWWNWNGKGRKNIKFILLKFTQFILEEVKFCPYCGKMPLISYGENKDKRAYDLDHIYPWTAYPYLTFNLYNLVPTCKVCNTIKNDKNLTAYGDYFHPYFWYIQSDKIRIDSKKDFDSEMDFSAYKKTLLSAHSRLFTLHDIYKNAQDTWNDLDFIRDKIWHIGTYGKSLDSIGIRDKKAFFFKNFYPEKSEDILKFANGKLKKDMIKSLKI